MAVSQSSRPAATTNASIVKNGESMRMIAARCAAAVG